MVSLKCCFQTYPILAESPSISLKVVGTDAAADDLLTCWPIDKLKGSEIHSACWVVPSKGNKRTTTKTLKKDLNLLKKIPILILQQSQQSHCCCVSEFREKLATHLNSKRKKYFSLHRLPISLKLFPSYNGIQVTVIFTCTQTYAHLHKHTHYLQEQFF